MRTIFFGSKYKHVLYLCLSKITTHHNIDHTIFYIKFKNLLSAIRVLERDTRTSVGIGVPLKSI